MEQSGVGWFIGKRFYGSFRYADGLKLLCPSIGGLQKMVNICEEFSVEYDLILMRKRLLVYVMKVLIVVRLDQYI